MSTNDPTETHDERQEDRTEEGWTPELAAEAYRIYDAGKGEWWFDPEFEMQRKGDPRVYVTKDGAALVHRKAPTVAAETGPNFNGASATIHRPPPPTPKRPERSTAFHWNDDKYGVFMRISKEMFRDDRLTRNDLIVYTELAEDETGTLVSWPSTSELAERAGLSRKQVRGSIDRLVAYGWLAVVPWRDGRGDTESSCYVLYPRCHEFTVDDLRSIRLAGVPDTSREVKTPPRFRAGGQG